MSAEIIAFPNAAKAPPKYSDKVTFHRITWNALTGETKVSSSVEERDAHGRWVQVSDPEAPKVTPFEAHATSEEVAHFKALGYLVDRLIETVGRAAAIEFVLSATRARGLLLKKDFEA